MYGSAALERFYSLLSTLQHMVRCKNIKATIALILSGMNCPCAPKWCNKITIYYDRACDSGGAQEPAESTTNDTALLFSLVRHDTDTPLTARYLLPYNEFSLISDDLTYMRAILAAAGHHIRRAIKYHNQPLPHIIAPFFAVIYLAHSIISNHGAPPTQQTEITLSKHLRATLTPNENGEVEIVFHAHQPRGRPARNEETT